MILREARLAEKAGMRVHQYKNLYFSILISTSICLSLNPAFFLSIVSTSRTVKLLAVPWRGREESRTSSFVQVVESCLLP